MGLRDRLAKALSLPAGATTMTEQQIAAMVPQSGNFAEPLERNIADAVTPFPAGMPLIPALINQPRKDGRADPRRWEFPVAWNLQIVEQRAIPFKTLREVADGADIVRKCIEVNKAAIAGMQWDISISEDAIARVMAEQNVGNTIAAQIVRDKYQAEITRAKDFWRMPDRLNGLTFQEWTMMVIEEVLVIDALSIYPNRTNDNKELHSLEILDGATIKPLLNERGGRPVPPYPAFQQILWGFPRGEFTATAEGLEVDGEYTADDLIYAPRNRRTNTPYGFSPVERCLVLVDLYMKRLQWLRSEFTDGATPDLMMKTDMEFGNNPQILTQYEQIMNDALAGNIEQRRRLRMLPNGFDPVFTPNSDAKYAMTLDDWLIKQICGHFGVLPTQIGMTAAGTLGETGHQEGEANTAQALGIQPLVMWLQDLFDQLSHRFLGMPRDLCFRLSDGTESDEMAQATRRQLEIFSGQKTWNEVRTEMGLPLFTFPEADAPIIVQGNLMPLSSAFESVEVNAESQDLRNPEKEVEETVQAEESTPADEVKMAELSKFIKWTKTSRSRDFVFKSVDSEVAELLNGVVRVDEQLARDIAADLRKQGGNPKARRGREPFPKNHPARAKSDQLFALYTHRIGLLGNVDTEKLAEAWLNSPHNNADEWLKERNISLLGSRHVQLLKDLYIESWYMARQASQAMVDGVRKKQKAAKKPDYPPADWQGWKAGDADTARLLLGESGQGTGLGQLLRNSNIVIQGINETTLNRMGRALALGFEKGFGVTEVKQMLDVILDDPKRAQMIAATEMARAVAISNIATLRENNTTMVDWQTSGDADVCEDCAQMEADSPYSIDSLPEEPPLHPFCGCQLVPAEFDDEAAMTEDGEQPDDPEVPEAEPVTEELPEIQEPIDHANVREEPLVDWTEIDESAFPNMGDRFQNDYGASVEDSRLSELYGSANIFSPSITPEMANTITNYQRSGYKYINGYLRNEELNQTPENTERIVNSIRTLDAAMEVMPELDRPIVTYRGIENAGFVDRIMSSEIGQQFTDSAYGSTTFWQRRSLDFGEPTNGVTLEIIHPTGSKGISMNNVLLGGSVFRTEYEYLIPRNQTYEVVSIDKQTKTVRVVRVNQ